MINIILLILATIKQENNIDECLDRQATSIDNLLIMNHRFRDEITKQQCDQLRSFKTSFTLEDLHGLAIDLGKDNVAQKHRAIIGIRKIVSLESPSPIKKVNDEGVVPLLISLAQQIKYNHLRLEAAWALSNITNGNTCQCEEVVNRGGIQLFVKLLKDKKFKIFEQAVWGIENIASAKPLYRDAIITKGGITKLLKFSKKFSNQRLLKHCCWAISTLCRGSPLPQSERVRSGVVFLCKILVKTKFQDQDYLNECCWVIYYHVRHIIRSKEGLLRSLIPKLIGFCNQTELPIVVPAIIIIGELSLIQQQINELLSYGILAALQKLIKHPRRTVRSKACLIISKITAGTQEQRDAVIEKRYLVQSLVDCFYYDSVDVRSKICFIFTRLAYQRNHNIIYAFYHQNKILACYCRLLEADTITVDAALQCLCEIVASAKKLSQTAALFLTQQLQGLGILLQLEKLQCRSSDRIVDQARRLMTYFDQEKAQKFD